MGTIHKHSTQSRNLGIMTNKNWTCIKISKGIKSIKNIKVDNNYLCARTCDSDCSFTRVIKIFIPNMMCMFTAGNLKFNIENTSFLTLAGMV